jgi:hypothetical protein
MFFFVNISGCLISAPQAGRLGEVRHPFARANAAQQEPGADVIMINFCDFFVNFRRKKIAIFLKNNVMIKFLQKSM